MSENAYANDDLVYVDPDKRLVVGRVEFTRNGNAKALEMQGKFEAPVKEEPEPEVVPKEGTAPAALKGRVGRVFRGKPRKRYYPWGTYRTMKKIYRLEGRVPEVEHQITLEDAIQKSLNEPFWDTEQISNEEIKQ